jgi:hypothetical protein
MTDFNLPRHHERNLYAGGIIVAFTVAGAFFLIWYRSRDTNDSETISDSYALDEARFPWEPRATHSKAISTKNAKNPTHDHQQKLDFLASMTFAHGGMIAPRCPCCQ